MFKITEAKLCLAALAPTDTSVKPSEFYLVLLLKISFILVFSRAEGEEGDFTQKNLFYSRYYYRCPKLRLFKKIVNVFFNVLLPRAKKNGLDQLFKINLKSVHASTIGSWFQFDFTICFLGCVL